MPGTLYDKDHMSDIAGEVARRCKTGAAGAGFESKLIEGTVT